MIINIASNNFISCITESSKIHYTIFYQIDNKKETEYSVSCNKKPATSYFPRQLPTKYHRRYGA